MNIIGWVWHDDSAAVIENLFCPADPNGHLFSELALNDGLYRLEDLLGQSESDPEIDEREEDEPDEELGAFGKDTKPPKKSVLRVPILHDRSIPAARELTQLIRRLVRQAATYDRGYPPLPFRGPLLVSLLDEPCLLLLLFDNPGDSAGKVFVEAYSLSEGVPVMTTECQKVLSDAALPWRNKDEIIDRIASFTPGDVTQKLWERWWS